MPNILIALDDIPPEGLSLVVDDPQVWAEPMKEFGMTCRVTRPLTAEIFLLSQDDGCLIRGRLTGEVVLPCNRCMEDATVTLDVAFDEFESCPVTDGMEEGEEDDADDNAVLIRDNGRLMFDIAALLWEEFSLALPVKPLCSSSCLGVCPYCGHNRNQGPCVCAPDEGDPRFAALRQKKVQ